MGEDTLSYLDIWLTPEPFNKSLQEAVNTVWVKLSRLEKVQELWTYTDETLVLRCDVPFAIPAGLPITWMFAPNVRTEEISLFKELQGNPGKPSRLTIEQPEPGTVACRLGEPFEPIARKFFYLNVSEGSVAEERGLQAMFSTVLHWRHNESPVPPLPVMGLALAVSSMVLVLVVGDCSELSTGSQSGVYIIQPTGLHPIMVYCEMGEADGGWTVIQRNRQDTDITWNESWSTYKHGFGNVHTEYWLGTENIYQITKQKIYQVRFLIWDASNNKRFADYNLFSLDDESQGYRLRLGAHSGTAEDAMDSDNPRKVHNNMKFSTKDRDQDTYRGNCASRYGGGWWYSACYSVRLNVKGSITWGRLCKGNCKASAILIKPAPYH
ncbi:tenascin-R-like protein [Willisornis vidua]|uniref:Tenascin-R-like protein n=1 Tax=Willisornis vidua TaxID=1566151 RepID=A0ABQ9DIS4_9PASS|nr:tenascin-R-like protein [Willisornis vidua]